MVTIFTNPNFAVGKPHPTALAVAQAPSSALAKSIIATYNSFKTNVQALNSSKSLARNNISTTAVKPSPKKSLMLGARTIAAQQALSEKFGIPTFNLKGGGSTLPQTRPLDTRINVGVGGFGLTLDTFNELIGRFTPKTFLVPSQEVFTPGLGGITLQPVGAAPAPGELILPAQAAGASFVDSIRKGFKDVTSTIGPLGIAIGLGVLALVVLKR